MKVELRAEWKPKFSSCQVELQAVSAASGYQSFIVHAATPLPALPANSPQYQFAIGPRRRPSFQSLCDHLQRHR
jgi:hypothetical protein